MDTESAGRQRGTRRRAVASAAVVLLASYGAYAWWTHPASELAADGPATAASELWSFVIDGDRLSLLQGRLDPGRTDGSVLFGPGPWEDVIDEYCGTLDPASVRAVEGTLDYAATFGGTRLLLGSVERQMTRRYCNQ